MFFMGIKFLKILPLTLSKMAKKREIGFRTKILSNYNYLKEVPVDAKKTNRFNFAIGHYTQHFKK